jgi:hypothetical protein
VHNIPTLKTWVGFASIWTIINLPGLLSHNIDIISWIEGILSSFDYPKFRGLFRYCRIKPPAFEYDWPRCFFTMVLELIYFFNCAIIVLLLSAGRNYAGRIYSGIRGLCIGPTLLVACCVKAISIHIISVK